MRLSAVTGLLLTLSLACTLFDEEKSGDSTATDTGEVSLDPGHQTGSCRDYLACAAEVDEQSYDKRKDEYGEDGDCWTTESSQYDCDEDCETWLEELQEENPGEPACRDGSGDDTDTDTDTDTDDTGGGTGDGCALDEGEWEFILWMEYDTCLGGADELAMYAEVQCEGDGAFTLELYDLLPGYPLECAGDGWGWSCQDSTSSFNAVAYGEASSGGMSTDVWFEFESDGCQMLGGGDGELR